MIIVSKKAEERQQWLNSLKVGDEVAIYRSNHWGSNHTIGKITKITPSRMFDVDVAPNCRFNSDGRERGNYYGRKIVESTDKIKNKIIMDQALSTIKNTVWESLQPQQLLEILKVIQSQ